MIAGGTKTSERLSALDALAVAAPVLNRPSRPREAPRHALCWIAYSPAGDLLALSQTATRTPPPILALLKRRVGWRTHGAFRELTVGRSTRYILPANNRAFLAQPPCATATFLMGDRSLEATMELVVGKGLPIQLNGTAPIDGINGQQALLRREDSNDERTGIWQRIGSAWLHITGATTAQQEALLKRLKLTTRGD